MKPAPGFILGTAQLGAAYGRTNQVGNLSDRQALQLLEAAYDRGVRDIDTARAYGLSEQRIGEFIRIHGLRDLRVFTKLSPLADLAADASEDEVREAVRRSLEESLKLLRLERLPAVLLHRPGHCDAFGGVVLAELGRWQRGGVIGMLGASVNTPAELNGVLRHADLRHIQLPFNLLDRRWIVLPPAAFERPIFHVRSVFLQGLLANPGRDVWPDVPGYSPGTIVRALEKVTARLHRKSVRDLAVAFVRAQPWIAGCVLGMEQPDQLDETLALFSEPPLTAIEQETVLRSMPTVPASLVEPWTWPPLKAA